MAIPTYDGLFDPGNSIDWKDFANCRGLSKENYDTFYAPIGGNYNVAKDICAGCSVTDECLEYALLYEKLAQRRFGCYGGMSPNERNDMFGNLGDPDTIHPRAHPERTLP